MCEPNTLGVIGMATQGLGSVMSANASQREGDYLQKVAEKNAATLDAAAQDAADRGAKEAGYSRMQTTAGIEASRAAYGASGVDGSVGTPLRQAGDTRFMGEMDARTIAANAAREAWGYKVEAERTREEGRFSQLRAKNQAFGTLLGAGGNMANSAAGLYARGKG